MPYKRGRARDFDDLISQLADWATDADIHGEAAWELMRNEPWPRGTILKAHGQQAGEHFYVGLMPQKFRKGSTYQAWFLQPEIIARHFVWPVTGAQTFYQSGANITIKKDVWNDKETLTDTYNLAEVDIFENNGQALFFGAFKQYASGLAWHEQPGGLTFENVAPRSANIYRGGYKAKYTPPLYPGVGYPAIGMDYDGPLSGYLDYWLVKDGSRMTVVVRNQEYWDVAHCGLLEPYQAKMQYSFPAVVIGGTSGAVWKGRLGNEGAIEQGIQFDYSNKDWSLIRGIPQFAACPVDNNNTLSQVAVMLPDGRWRFAANWMQGIELIPITQGSSYYIANGRPVRTQNLQYYIRPTCTDLRDVAYVLQPEDGVTIYQMEPVELVEAGAIVRNMLGAVKGMFWPSQRVIKYGEILIGGKKYLMVPNGWEDRPWYIEHGRSGIYDAAVLAQRQKEIDAISQQMNCLIRLED